MKVLTKYLRQLLWHSPFIVMIILIIIGLHSVHSQTTDNTTISSICPGIGSWNIVKFLLLLLLVVGIGKLIERGIPPNIDGGFNLVIVTGTNCGT